MLDMESARKEKRWRKLAETGQNLLLTHDLSDDVRTLGRAAVSDGYYTLDDAEEFRSLDYDGLLNRLNSNIEATSDVADHYWLQALLQERRLFYRRRGNWRQIVKDLAKAIELNSSRSEYFFCRAILYRRHAHDYTRSLVDCRTAIGLDPSKASYVACRGTTYHDAAAHNHPLGDYEKALADYTQAIMLEPTWADLYWMRAQIYRATGDELSAANDEGSACEIDPLSAAWRYANRARQRSSSETDAAMLDANRAISLDPESAFAYDSRANVWRWKDKYDLAVRDHQRAIQIEPDRPDWYLSRAVTYRLERESELALADCNHAIRLSPNAAECYEVRAGQFQWQQEYEQAIADYSKAIELDPQSRFFAGRAEVYVEQGQYHQAVVEYTHALEQEWSGPSKSYYFLRRSRVYEELGDYEKAILDYTEVIELNSRILSAVGYSGRADIFLKQGNYAKAQGDLAMAYELNPDSEYRHSKAESLRMEGWRCNHDGRREEAVVRLTWAITFNPKNAKAYVDRGEVYLDSEDYESAYGDFTAAVNIEPGIVNTLHVEYWGNQGNEYRKKGDYASALKSYAKCIALGVSHYYISRAKIYAELGDYGNAIADCMKGIELNPDSLSSYDTRGRIYFEMGDLDKAQRDFTKLAEIDPSSDDSWWYSRGCDGLSRLARTYIDKGDYESAVDIHKKLIRLQPEHSNFGYDWKDRGDNHLKNDDYDRAIICFDNAIGLDPSLAHEVLFFRRGQAHHGNRDYAKAIIDFSKVIELHSSSGTYFFYRGRSYHAAADIKHPSGSYARAIVDYTEAITLSPRLASFYESRALCYEALGDASCAQADWIQAKKLK